MSVLVIGLNGRPLMPTTTRKARILLKANKASVICRNPFTIHLWYKTGCATQEGSIGVDTGSQNIGIAVTAGGRPAGPESGAYPPFLHGETGADRGKGGIP